MYSANRKFSVPWEEAESFRIIDQQPVTRTNLPKRHMLTLDRCDPRVPGLPYSSPCIRIQSPLVSRLYQRCLNAIAQVESCSGFGTAFFIDAGGKLVTDFHCLAGGSELRVSVLDRGNFNARLICADRKEDLAILQILEIDGQRPFDTLPLEEVEVFEDGSPAFAFGYPRAIPYLVVSPGNVVISDTVHGKYRKHRRGRISLDMNVQAGNSGGPILNEQGQVIGIVRESSGPDSHGAITYAASVGTLNKLLRTSNAKADVDEEGGIGALNNGSR